jgi:hypothetical protein
VECFQSRRLFPLEKDLAVFPFWIDLHVTLPQGMIAMFGATFLMTHFVLARR